MFEHTFELQTITELLDTDFANFHIPCPLAITRYDEEFTIIEANKSFFDFIGYNKEEVRDLFENKGRRFLHPDESDQLIADFAHQIQQSSQNVFNTKGRYLSKDGDYKLANFLGRVFHSKTWDEPLISFAMFDISEQWRLLQELEEEREFNNLISTLTDDTFFDCDLRTKVIRYSKSFADKMGIHEIMTNYPQCLIELGMIGEESLHLYEMRYQTGTFDEIKEDEIHLISSEGQHYWYDSFYRILTDSDGTPIRAIGKMNDITKQHIEIDKLTQKAQRDQLTTLYNKVTTEYLIKETLRRAVSPEDHCALFIIDIDNFKNINDRIGHLYGDIVLTQLAEHLKGIFRNTDVLGRIGGDEFFVFIKNYNSVDALKAKAIEICRRFKKTYTENGVVVDISASIGIALFPEHGTRYDELYKNADIALYSAKEKGKNTFVFFHESINSNYRSTRTEIDIESYVQKSFKEHRSEYVFKILYSADDARGSINLALRLIAEQFNFTRVYITEFSEDKTTFSKTFEWYESQHGKRKVSLKNLPVSSLASLVNAIRETGIFVVNKPEDVTDPQERMLLDQQEVKSMITFAIKDSGVLKGFIGFDDCKKTRTFTSEDMDELSTICHVLGTFLIKLRVAEAQLNTNMMLSSIMENLEGYAYVVDKETYTVLYENINVVQLTQKNSIGLICYETYIGRTQPCENCPIMGLSPTKKKNVVQFYNEQYNLLTKTTGSAIRWSDGSDAYLINSLNVHAYD